MDQRQPTLLLGDNNPICLEENTGWLREAGYSSILQAEEGPEAWAMFKNFTVDMVICSWEMPRISGLALLKLIRDDAEFSSTPFIMIVDQVTSKLVVQAGRAGVDDIILRPFTRETFIKKIKDTLQFGQEADTQEAGKRLQNGLELMKAGQYDEALKSFESILSVHENAEVYYNMGFINSIKELYEDALKCFRRATQINNSYARAYKMMAEVHVKLGQNDLAEENLRQAGTIFMERRQYQEAEEIFRQVMKINPDTINVFNGLGIIYRRQGKVKEAIQQYKKALRVHPKDEHIYYNLSRVYLDIKDYDNAKKALEDSIKARPDFSQAKELLLAIEMGQTTHE
ncbi:MAG: tetratricopeptide repeat protein [Deltaproteobacteria bacterium]|nr:tetratricopeptide repeat protein [Deltaproteobacteria bacterium]